MPLQKVYNKGERVSTMKLSILDQAPISSNQTAQEALQASVQLARLGDALGFERFWIAEHHDLFGLACPNPDVMLGVIGAQTERIRIGAGAVLLPYYKPYRVAETYNLLQTLYPNRVDLGLGRAPGGSAEVSLALSDNYLKQVQQYSNDIETLQGFLHGTYDADHPYGKITPTPVPAIPPALWLLGTSDKSAVLAAEKGMDYVFGHFMTSLDGPQVVQTYREKMKKQHEQTGYVIVAVHVICAKTTKEAEDLAGSTLLWGIKQEQQDVDHHIPSVEEAKNYPYTEEDLEKIARRKKQMIIGNPVEVKEQLANLQARYHADELMIVTITHEPETKYASYQLVASQCIDER